MRIIAVVVAGAVGLASVAHADKADPVKTGLTRLAAGAKCTDKASPWRPWCIAADWSKGAAGSLPTKSLVGMTIEIEEGKDIAEALSQKVTFVALAIDEGGKVKLTDVKPGNEAEVTTVGEAVFAATSVFKDKAKVAKLPAELASYVRALKGTYATKKVGNAWAWTGKSTSQLRKVGKFYVVIERAEAETGIWATILTESWE